MTFGTDSDSQENNKRSLCSFFSGNRADQISQGRVCDGNKERFNFIRDGITIITEANFCLLRFSGAELQALRVREMCTWYIKEHTTRDCIINQGERETHEREERRE